MPEYRCTVATIFNGDARDVDDHMAMMGGQGWRLVSAVNDTTSHFYFFWEKS